MAFRVSYKWLAEHVKEKLPSPHDLADAITLHAFQVDRVEEVGDDANLEIDVLPNRAHDCLSFAGVAREVALILSLTSIDPFEETKRRFQEIHGAGRRDFPLRVSVEDSVRCRRYMARVMAGVSAGDSPAWLSERLSAVGQRSINVLVDIANFVMLETGQPLHVFDADKVGGEIVVRPARRGERMETLDGKEVALDDTMLIIAGGEKVGEVPLALAGIKGGTIAAVDSSTRNIIVEAANFSPTVTRKTAHAVGIHTDAVKRFENGITPEMAGGAMELFCALAAEYAGGESVAVGEIIDIYPRPTGVYMTGISVAEAEAILGAPLGAEKIEQVFDRLGWKIENVHPLERVIALAESLVGVPYKFGASVSYDAPRFFDCSSFTAYVFSRAGITLPRMTADQWVATEEMSREDLAPGDIVFALTSEPDGMEFARESDGAPMKAPPVYSMSMEYVPNTGIPGGVNHCGIYLGEGRVIHASGKWHKGAVVIEALSDSPAFADIRGYRRVRGADSERFVIIVPAERLDIRMKEDIAEEIGRIAGYKNIPATSLPSIQKIPSVYPEFYVANVVRNILVDAGFSELYTSSFAESGEVEMENPIAENKKFLRRDLLSHLAGKLDWNAQYADLLGTEDMRIFEIGHVFNEDKEVLSLAMGIKYGKKKKGRESARDLLLSIHTRICKELGIEEKNAPGPVYEDGGDSTIAEIDMDALLALATLPAEYGAVLRTPQGNVAYKKISPFPFIARDIALFVPSDMTADIVSGVLSASAGNLLARTPRLFDVFHKKFPDGNEKASYAFRLVFQSDECTLTDTEANEVMARVYAECAKHGWTVR